MHSRRYRADVKHKSGQSIINTVDGVGRTVGADAPQDGLSSFIVRLHQLCGMRGARLALIGGIGPLTYAGGCVMLALVAIAITDCSHGRRQLNSGALFLVGFAALFGWQMGGFIWRNKPRIYTFDGLRKRCCRKVSQSAQ